MELIKSATTSRAWPRHLRGAFLIPPALLVVADLFSSKTKTPLSLREPGLIDSINHFDTPDEIEGEHLVSDNYFLYSYRSIYKDNYWMSIVILNIISAGPEYQK